MRLPKKLLRYGAHEPHVYEPLFFIADVSADRRQGALAPRHAGNFTSPLRSNAPRQFRESSYESPSMFVPFLSEHLEMADQLVAREEMKKIRMQR